MNKQGSQYLLTLYLVFQHFSKKIILYLNPQGVSANKKEEILGLYPKIFEYLTRSHILKI